ncbi:hypothetical protein DB88DRAFT_9665 [Papiliotrema laurentii]|uniref:Xylanolytic transcriptional activator regulatory domain-containing protein n=1 Tax=Papiliotrema laurentii TaxID=5418 RepID=A0AAD9FVY9_PAPLA|nr:hypothetical protein DB88DRAFT_9665 [Papiliotrema laurentii]
MTSTIYDPSSMPPPPTIPQPDLHPPETSFQIISPHSLGSNISQQTEGGNDHDNDLSNPVRLLAEAAEEGGPSVQPTIMAEPVLPLQYTLPETIHAMLHDGDVDPRVADLRSDTEYLAQGLEAMLSDTAQRSLTQEDMRFFKPARNQVKRDVGSEYDPVDLALVTLREVRVFLESFFNKLHPVLPVLDPILHTPEWIRGRSAFLLTAICAHGASMTVGAEEATKRLRIHAQRLSELISRRRFASVEIVQAFLIWISWLPSSHPFQEEKLWHETKFAINMAVELEIAKPRREEVDSGMDSSLLACLEGMPLDEQTVDRIRRNRDRLWLQLFLLDSSLSLAFGKATRFSQDHLTRDENWCFHPLATQYDAVVTACVVLRRRLVILSETLRSEILTRSNTSSDWVIRRVDEVLDPWYQLWSQRCRNDPYLELMYRHTRLWSLTYALQSLSARGGSVQALTEDCFGAALSSCEFVCEQLRQSKCLWGLPNTMGPMLSFEVLLAVRLFPVTSGHGTASRARVLGLLSQLAILLERVGTTPRHRLGTAAVYGRHLQVYLRRRIVALCLAHDRQDLNAGGGFTLTGFDLSPGRQAETSIQQIFGSNQISPTDQAQASMNLVWDDVNTLNFLDSTSGWPDDFFRIFGQ